jgi:hypothetical protein
VNQYYAEAIESILRSLIVTILDGPVSYNSPLSYNAHNVGHLQFLKCIPLKIPLNSLGVFTIPISRNSAACNKFSPISFHSILQGI